MSRHAEPAIQDSTSPARPAAWHGGVYIAVAIAIASGLLIYLDSPLAFYSAVIDGLPALGIVAAASAAGLWLVWASGNGDLPIRWQIGLGAGFGLGILSLSMLLAGLKGHLGQRFWFIALTLLVIASIAAIYRLGRIAHKPSLIAAPKDDDAQSRAAGRWRWLWLLIVPSIVLGVLAATVPPGLLWPEEGNGYDVLEYHLGVPKEYFFLGRIEYLDHNMYSNFPMNAEMLYLLPMVLYASPFKAAITAQMIHLLLGGLAGYVAWLIGRDYSRKVGILTGIAGVAFPWSIYLVGLAYVENGMLFYGLLVAGLCNRAIRDPSERTCFRALAVGAMVGLACGYKYTAIPMIAVPLLALWAILNLASRPARFSNALIPVLIAAAFFAPWMAKNQRMTGDPFFPLGHRVFASRVWSDADYAKFQLGHAPLPAEQSLPARFDALWHRVLIDPRWGYVPWIVAATAAGLVVSGRIGRRVQPPNSRGGEGETRRGGETATTGKGYSPLTTTTKGAVPFFPESFSREVLIWLAVLAVQIVVWLFATHLFARFASILWIPLIFLVSTLAAWATRACSCESVAQPAAGRHSEGRSQRSEARGQRSEIRSQKSEVRSQRSALRTQYSVLAVLALLVYLAIGQGWLFGQYRGLFESPEMKALHGNTELFFTGQMPSLDHLNYINGDGTPENPGLPYDAKVLMVGDARIFYVNRSCDYCVVFSRDRFARAIDEAGGSAGGILRWLQQQGYTHVWANFGELGRLSGTYGLPPQLSRDLFPRLETAGLKRLHEVRLPVGGADRLYGIFYEVPKP